jgi:glycosyltransferase involved in cell wall biosynthesis
MPIVSILITTFNRGKLLKRAINSVLEQEFTDFELVIIDDCSKKGENEFVLDYKDERIFYIRNEENQGKVHGDRIHIKRFIDSIARGKYFVYLCDDDYWLTTKFLKNAVEMHESDSSLAMVLHGQLSVFVEKIKNGLYGPGHDLYQIDQDKLAIYLDKYFVSKVDCLSYMRQLNGNSLYSKWYMSSKEYLIEFARNPTLRNTIAGAVVYNMEIFKKSKTLTSLKGSKWQAGYELAMTPGMYGNVVFIDRPAIATEIHSTNASFRGTQIQHLYDSLFGLDCAFSNILTKNDGIENIKFLTKIKKRTLVKICMAFIGNTSTILRNNQLTICGEDNISKFLGPFECVKILIKNRALSHLEYTDIKKIILVVRLKFFYKIGKLIGAIL